MSFSRKKKHPEAPSRLTASLSGLASSRVASSQQPQIPTPKSQSLLLQGKQQSQPVGPWSAHFHQFGKSQSPFPRCSCALTMSGDEMFLFGGYTLRSRSPSNDLYVISTQDFSTTLLQTSGDVPSPRLGHCAVLTGTTFLIWGGKTDFRELNNAQLNCNDDSFYLLNLVSRVWTRIVANGPGPCGRLNHAMTLVDSKLFVFGGTAGNMGLNDIWALDLNCLKSNPFWESYEPTPGNEKPLPRAGHVSVTIGNRIIIFGGGNSTRNFNDTWSFNISTRKWTELRCTGPIPTPRAGHAAVLIDDVMYVYGGGTPNETYLSDLSALNLSTQQWITFQDKGLTPCGRLSHSMARYGTRVFVIGGALSPRAQADEAQLIHVLDTKLLIHPQLDSNTLKQSGKTSQLAQKSSVGHPTRRQPHQPSSDQAKLVAPDTPSGKEITPLEDGRFVELELQLSETLAAKTERDHRIGQLIDELAEAAGEKKRAGLELRELQAKLDELMMSRDRSLEQAKASAAQEKKRAGVELRELQAKFDGSLLSHDHALEQARANAAEERKCAELELHELQAKLVSRDRAFEQAKANAAEEKKRSGQELRELQAKIDKLLLSLDDALEQLQSSAEAKEQIQRDLAEMRAELKASKSESAALRMRLADTENGGSKSKAEEDNYCTPAASGLVNLEEDRVIHKLMERMRVMEAEVASLRLNEKSFETMECRNED